MKQLYQLPLVSILMPARNSEQFIAEAVQSVLAQTYSNWELIIIDDASTDRTWEIAQKLVAADSRIRLLRNAERVNIGESMNRLLAAAKGRIIARMDSDDIMLPERLEKQVAFLEEHPEVGIVGGYLRDISESGLGPIRSAPLDHERIKRGMYNFQTIFNSTLMVHRDRVGEKEMHFDSRLSPVDDLDFLFRQLMSGRAIFRNLPEVFLHYRKHDANSSFINIKRTFALTQAVRRKAVAEYGYLPTLGQKLVNLLQAALVRLLPNAAVYPIVRWWRTRKKPTKSTIFFGYLLALGSAVIMAQAFVPGTFIIGIDNFTIELDTWLNFKRTFFVWQENHGLGLLSAFAYMSEAPRALLYWFGDIILPAHALRWLWISAMLMIGPLGCFILLRHFFRSLARPLFVDIAAFVGGAFYLLNFATVQIFYIPHESFISFYAFLPWWLLLAHRYLESGRRRDLLIFFIISFITSSTFLIQTVFIVWFMVLAWFLLASWLNERSWNMIKRSLTLLGLLMIANLYWLLPIGYFSVTQTSAVIESKQNFLATPENELATLGRGSLKDMALLRSSWLDTTDFGMTSSRSVPMFGEWVEWMVMPWIEVIGLTLWFLAMVGIFLVMRIRSPLRFVLVGYMALIFLMLARQVPASAVLYNWLADTIPLFGQIFRTTFTKWSAVAALTYSMGLGCLVFWVVRTVRFGTMRVLMVAVIVVACAGIYMWPVFRGNLIYDAVKQTLPSPYFSLFTWFKEQPPQSRVAFLPIQTFWGVEYHDWGYRGTGFIWYGLAQPILHRSFDTVRRENETFYHQMSTALYDCPAGGRSSDATVFKDCAEDIRDLLTTYRVDYLLLDESIVEATVRREHLRVDEIKKIASVLDFPLVFSDQFLSVWQVAPSRGFVTAPSMYTKVSADTALSRHDINLPDTLPSSVRIDGDDDEAALSFPFASIFREQSMGISYPATNQIAIRHPMNFIDTRTLTLPDLPRNHPVPFAGIAKLVGNSLIVRLTPFLTIHVDGRSVANYTWPDFSFEVPDSPAQIFFGIGQNIFSLTQNKTTEFFVEIMPDNALDFRIYDSHARPVEFGNQFIQEKPVRCAGNGLVSTERKSDEIAITVEAATACLPLKIGHVGDGYMRVSQDYRSASGARPHFCVTATGQGDTCLHKDVFYATPSSAAWQTVERDVVVHADMEYWFNLAARPREDEMKRSTIEYRAPRVLVYPLIATYTYPAGTWNEVRRRKEIDLDGIGQNIGVNILAQPQSLDFATRGSVNNCDALHRGWVEKKSTTQGVTYRAHDRGMACDYALLPHLSPKEGYLVRYRGEHVSGRTLKAYVTNWESERIDLEVSLGQGKFDDSFVLLPWQARTSTGYTFSVESRSFGFESAESRIESITLYALPFTWLHNIQISNNQATTPNPIDIVKANRQHPGRYDVTVRCQTNCQESESGLIVLAQGYDAGWVATDPNGHPLPHVRIDGWANGWRVPAGVNHITIAYLPQYLQWFGLLLVPMGALLIMTWRQQKKIAHLP